MYFRQFISVWLDVPTSLHGRERDLNNFRRVRVDFALFPGPIAIERLDHEPVTVTGSQLVEDEARICPFRFADIVIES